jgi:hypothetical protein
LTTGAVEADAMGLSTATHSEIPTVKSVRVMFMAVFLRCVDSNLFGGIDADEP